MTISRTKAKTIPKKPRSAPVKQARTDTGRGTKAGAARPQTITKTPVSDKKPVDAAVQADARKAAAADVQTRNLQSNLQNAVPGATVPGAATPTPVATAAADAVPNPGQDLVGPDGLINAPSPDGLTNAQVTEQGMRNVYTPTDGTTMDAIKAGEAGEIVRGHKGAAVNETQASLNKFGFNLAQDGMLGPQTEGALKTFQETSGLPVTGRLDAATHSALQAEPTQAQKDAIAPQVAAQQTPTELGAVTSERVPPAQRQQMIIDSIRSDPNIPDSWANDPGKLAAINRLVEKESGWRVGIPNYTITNAGMTGQQAAERLQTNNNLTRFGASSSAMGLFQLLGTNMDKYQPGGRTSIGDASSELAGGMRYMMDRYGSPERALQFHNNNNWW